jgi:hypothetical protein
MPQLLQDNNMQDHATPLFTKLKFWKNGVAPTSVGLASYTLYELKLLHARGATTVKHVLSSDLGGAPADDLLRSRSTVTNECDAVAEDALGRFAQISEVLTSECYWFQK